jgi:hypothetical protein
VAALTAASGLVVTAAPWQPIRPVLRRDTLLAGVDVLVRRLPRERPRGFDLSKGTVRFTPENRLPEAALELLLRHRLCELERA